MTYIMIALGWILNLFYRLVNNYGVAIILFTVFVKLVLLPLDLKQRKSMAKTQKIQPLLMEVQKKYANDKEKLSQETMKLYQKYGINPSRTRNWIEISKSIKTTKQTKNRTKKRLSSILFAKMQKNHYLCAHFMLNDQKDITKSLITE